MKEEMPLLCSALRTADANKHMRLREMSSVGYDALKGTCNIFKIPSSLVGSGGKFSYRL